MGLYCDDGAIAEITPHVSVPPLAKGETRPRILEPERDRCQRPTCRKVAWQHHTTPLMSDAVREAIRRILS
jgi:hypothetical protein